MLRIRRRIEERVRNLIIGQDFQKDKVKIQVELPRFELPRLPMLPRLQILPKIKVEVEYKRKENKP